MNRPATTLLTAIAGVALLSSGCAASAHGTDVSTPPASVHSAAAATPLGGQQTTHPAKSLPAERPSTRGARRPHTTPATPPSPTRPATRHATTARATTTPPAAHGTALALLATLPVKGRAANTGYSRGQFGPAWTDDNDDPDGHNGCRTRDDILRRDLTHVVASDGCTVRSGVLTDPYTGKVIHFVRGVGTSTAVQIDHVVALDDAWQTGAQQWSAAKRTDLANDPLNLLAVDGPTNESKGAGDAATWLPPNKSYRCAYVARQVAVKARYGLWVTHAEHDAIARVLSACPGQPAPTEGQPPPAVHPRSTEPVTHSTTPATHPTSSHNRSTSSAPTVVTYPNCAALNAVYPHGVGLPGAHDHTSGTPDTDFLVDAALYRANTGRDGDKDGIACER